jgi:hypothetical protein
MLDLPVARALLNNHLNCVQSMLDTSRQIGYDFHALHCVLGIE